MGKWENQSINRELSINRTFHGFSTFYMDQLGNICRYDLKERLKINKNEKFEIHLSFA